jgi:L-amino acid N-acyltransferase YncA
MIRRTGAGDRDRLLAFAEGLPEHDLLFLGRDLKHPRVVDAWVAATEEGAIDSLVDEGEDGGVCGTAALIRDPLGWSGHVGEVRLLVSPEARGGGVGRRLLEELIRIAVNDHALAKLTARMTPDQRGAIELFESAGFRGEAMLRDQVADRQGRRHDIAILSLDLERDASRREAFGLAKG